MGIEDGDKCYYDRYVHEFRISEQSADVVLALRREDDMGTVPRRELCG